MPVGRIAHDSGPLGQETNQTFAGAVPIRGSSHTGMVESGSFIGKVKYHVVLIKELVLGEIKGNNSAQDSAAHHPSWTRMGLLLQTWHRQHIPIPGTV